MHVAAIARLRSCFKQASFTAVLPPQPPPECFIIIIIIIIIIIPCKPYLSASATAPHPLGRRKVERLFSLFSVNALSAVHVAASLLWDTYTHMRIDTMLSFCG
jgi:hypothetical protein